MAGGCGAKRDGEVCLRQVLLGAGGGRVGWWDVVLDAGRVDVGRVDALDGFAQRIMVRCARQSVACDYPFRDQDIFEQGIKAY